MNDLRSQSFQAPSKGSLFSFICATIPNIEFCPKDWDVVEKLLDLAIVPNGQEDPHDWLRSMSSKALDQLFTHLDALQSHNTFRMVSQFFLIEWSYRNEYLDADWKWVWDTRRDGHVRYKSKFSLDSLFTRNNLC